MPVARPARHPESIVARHRSTRTRSHRQRGQRGRDPAGLRRYTGNSRLAHPRSPGASNVDGGVFPTARYRLHQRPGPSAHASTSCIQPRSRTRPSANATHDPVERSAVPLLRRHLRAEAPTQGGSPPCLPTRRMPASTPRHPNATISRNQPQRVIAIRTVREDWRYQVFRTPPRLAISFVALPSAPKRFDQRPRRHTAEQRWIRHLEGGVGLGVSHLRTFAADEMTRPEPFIPPS